MRNRWKILAGLAPLTLGILLGAGCSGPPAEESKKPEPKKATTAPEPVVVEHDPLPGETMHLGFETDKEILGDFISRARRYREAKDPLAMRKLGLADGRFGKALHVKDGWSVSRGTWNESGLDCDLIVSTV